MLKGIIIFTSGVVAGGAATYFFLKKKIEDKCNKIADEKVQSMQDYVDSIRAKELAMEAGYVQKGIENYIPDSLKEKRKTSKERTENKGNTSEKKTVDYTHYYQNAGEAHVTNMTEELINQYFAERESPREDPTAEEVEERKRLEAEKKALEDSIRMTEEVNSNKAPYPIRKDEFYDYDYQYLDKTTLYYYMDPNGGQTGVLATEEGEVVDPFEVVGDTLETTGFARNDEDGLYVRNLRRSTDYEIAKVYEPFDNQVL